MWNGTSGPWPFFRARRTTIIVVLGVPFGRTVRGDNRLHLHAHVRRAPSGNRSQLFVGLDDVSLVNTDRVVSAVAAQDPVKFLPRGVSCGGEIVGMKRYDGRRLRRCSLRLGGCPRTRRAMVPNRPY